MSQALAEGEVSPQPALPRGASFGPSQGTKEREKTARKLLGLGRGCWPPQTQSQAQTVRWAGSPPAGDLRSLRFSASPRPGSCRAGSRHGLGDFIG